MNFNTECGVGAVLKLIVRKADTDEIVRETPEFHNLVLTTGLARMAVDTWINRCCVGTGNSTPVASQVALDNFLASTKTTALGTTDTGGIQVTEAPFYWFGRSTWRFNVGVATGNISEVGLGWGDSNLWNRALVKDIEGNPTTITVLADEYLDVISEVRIYPKESTGVFNLVDKFGDIISTHSFTAKPRFSSGDAGWVVKTVGLYRNRFFYSSSAQLPNSPTEGISEATASQSAKTTALTAGMRCDCTLSSSEGNNVKAQTTFAIGLENLMCGNNNPQCGYNWIIDPPIPKDAETILTYSFTLTWGNYEPT